MKQSQVLDILKTGANVFLTGEPGSGKTHTINEYIEYLRDCKIEHAVTASTGIAATHIGGRTIHSWSGIGIANRLDGYLLDKVSSNEAVVKRVKKTRVLIIDEVSMLSSVTLSMVDAVLREIKNSKEPFGGLQVILVGDFFQLPPIKKKNIEVDSQAEMFDSKPQIFAYDSPAWKKLCPVVCYLTEQYRQDDSKFLGLLGAIRGNCFSGAHLSRLQKCKIEYADAPEDVPKLYSHNLDVDRVNREMLASKPGKPESYYMKSRGSKTLVETMKKGCLSPEVLELKKGAAVMFTKNNLQEGYVNGTLGVVEDFTWPSGNPVVRTRAGGLIEATRLEWALKDNDKTLATIEQIPLRLAWAITVHKSQGMSLDEATIDLSRVFEYGQGYVALSRVRRLSGVHLLGYNDRAFQVHPEILEKDKEFRNTSDAIAQVFVKMSAKEHSKMLSNFVKASNGVDVK
ncbi:MAG: PIF1 family DEAD/DEAH box helicase [bacterium]|nr:PIF1 family DEAD/DEAH box helicase [bacterium]